ncbi:MAG: ATP-dependent helicase, partial [Cytophagales bacterium]|nr:ATP-dependent helicase [Cytophagales bacterium]
MFDSQLSEQLEYNDFAILYRTNAQSRVFEESLRKRNIPYKIYGGLSFYQRKEIKDLLAYFRLIVNNNDEEALKRVINYPKRGIGVTTVQKIKTYADDAGVSMWSILSNLQTAPYDLNSGTIKKLTSFCNLIGNFSDRLDRDNAYDIASGIANSTGILTEMYNDRTPEGVSRHENIQELLNGIKDFTQNAIEEGKDCKMPVFLEDVALLTDQDSDKPEDRNKVTLMTVHSAKGLEFKYVYIVGLEEEL